MENQGNMREKKLCFHSLNQANKYQLVKEDEFLADSMMIYIERELVKDIDSDFIIDEFYSTKHRTVQL